MVHEAIVPVHGIPFLLPIYEKGNLTKPINDKTTKVLLFFFPSMIG